MEEAVELCKLRLYLLLASTLKHDENIASLANVNFPYSRGKCIGWLCPTPSGPS